MNMFRNNKGQVSVEWIIIAAAILAFAFMAMNKVRAKSDAKVTQVETAIGGGVGSNT
jgi:hypothetical protein